MASFRAALNAGDKGIELDVTLSSDGYPVIIHDDNVDRTTDGTGAVTGLNLEYIRSLDAGSWFDKRFKGEFVPLLSEVLEELGKSVFINIEIKSSAWRDGVNEGIEVRIMRIIETLDLLETVLVSSFEWRSLKRIRELDINIPLGVLVSRDQNPVTAVKFANDINAFSIHPDLRALREGIPDAYRTFGGKIFPYTVKSSFIGSLVLKAGADGYFADLPFLEN
ncbi:MAG: hypothetical protein KAH21_10420 [Spirochaetaceae bacterium]|nr:hypothetical protein [Spirochaetaceae bacterium]